jgi:hypothetical protein
MEILVYLDSEDKINIDKLVEYCNNNPATAYVEKDKFFVTLIEKYPVLKNRPIAFNRDDGYVFHFDGNKDLLKANIGIK